MQSPVVRWAVLGLLFAIPVLALLVAEHDLDRGEEGWAAEQVKELVMAASYKDAIGYSTAGETRQIATAEKMGTAITAGLMIALAASLVMVLIWSLAIGGGVRPWGPQAIARYGRSWWGLTALAVGLAVLLMGLMVYLNRPDPIGPATAMTVLTWGMLLGIAGLVGLVWYWLGTLLTTPVILRPVVPSLNSRMGEG